ncbi:unnamed protein product [marine sediment metagenome]|uniref:Uncharacterized protein n=1 Tax=marine sediment metagenome TaxID=412755 RepID=X1V833_9ZZZZ
MKRRFYTTRSQNEIPDKYIWMLGLNGNKEASEYWQSQNSQVSIQVPFACMKTGCRLSIPERK